MSLENVILKHAASQVACAGEMLKDCNDECECADAAFDQIMLVLNTLHNGMEGSRNA